jgi:hypothetical protein
LNGDGELTPSDVVLLLNYAFIGQPPPTGGLFAADLDCSFDLNPADVVVLMNSVFLGAPAPPRCL